MKKSVNLILTVFSIFAAVPTGWAIYAGVTEHPVFPMNTMCAILGAVGVISTSIAAGMLVTDIKAYNQGLHNITERKDFAMSTTSAWLIFGGCVLAEITLSLLIVVFPGALAFGVLVFPLMTAAGVFAFAVKYDLIEKEKDLQETKTKIENEVAIEKQKAEQKAALELEEHKKLLAERREVRRTKKESVAGANQVQGSPSQSVAQVQAVPASATHYPRKCEHCDAQIKAPQSVGAHMKKHHPELCKPKVLAENFFENVTVK